ncbi:MAG: hypothetical protein PWQ90_1522 [Pseudothermotoga sp.]|nr:hypothetical protein [Pseudothermotoga sp.]
MPCTRAPVRADRLQARNRRSLLRLFEQSLEDRAGFDTPNPLKGMGFLAALFRLPSMEHFIFLLHHHLFSLSPAQLESPDPLSVKQTVDLLERLNLVSLLFYRQNLHNERSI